MKLSKIAILSQKILVLPFQRSFWYFRCDFEFSTLSSRATFALLPVPVSRALSLPFVLLSLLSQGTPQCCRPFKYSAAKGQLGDNFKTNRRVQQVGSTPVDGWSYCGLRIVGQWSFLIWAADHQCVSLLISTNRGWSLPMAGSYRRHLDYPDCKGSCPPTSYLYLTQLPLHCIQCIKMYNCTLFCIFNYMCMWGHQKYLESGCIVYTMYTHTKSTSAQTHMFLDISDDQALVNSRPEQNRT